MSLDADRVVLRDVVLEHGLIPSLTLNCRTWGELRADGGNAIVFPPWLSGSGDALEAFELVGPGALADSARHFVVAIDPLGSDATSLPPGGITIGDQVDLQRRVLAECFGLTRVFAVIGISMGAVEAVEWALRHPQSVERVVAIAGTPRLTEGDRARLRPILDMILQVDEAPNRRLALLRLLAKEQRGLLAALRRGGRRQWRRGMFRSFYQFRGPNWRAQWESMLAYDACAGRGSLANTAGRVRARMLAVTCQDDDYLEPGPQRAFVAATPGARCVELAGDSGHLNFYTERETLTLMVHAFLEE